MTDQIPADKVREIIEKMHDHANHDNVRGNEEEYVRFFAEQLAKLLPAPPRPTLADMTTEERRDCQWMQADVTNRSVRYVIANPLDDENEAALIDPDGDICWLLPGRITPRPDLPRMTWPGTGQKAVPAPALPDGWRLADHKDHGRVIVTNPTPNSDGRVYYVLPSDGIIGNACDLCSPSELTYIDAEPGEAPVPPNTLAVGSVWDDVDALARACDESGRDQVVVADKDGDVFVWGADAGWWETGLPGCDYAPHTIIHTGKEADQ